MNRLSTRYDSATLKALLADAVAALPKDQKLLENLHTAGRLARKTNQLFEELTSLYLAHTRPGRVYEMIPNDIEPRRAELHAAADKARRGIVELCKHCEETLKGHFP